MSKKKPTYRLYYILNPDDDAEEHLKAYQDVHPDWNVYLATGNLITIDDDQAREPIHLTVIVCEE